MTNALLDEPARKPALVSVPQRRRHARRRLAACCT